MPNQIHPTAVIDPRAELGSDIEIGPYAVIDGDVRLGNGCRLGPHVYLTGKTRIGEANTFHAGCVIGDWPQDISYRGAPTETLIGDRNLFREHVTIHRSTAEDEPTTIGSDNFLMASSHIGHNARLGNRNILANCTLIGGHVIVEDQVTFGGNAAVHQFVRVGRLAMLRGHSGLSKDLPPFTILRDINKLSGLNAIGLRRAQFSLEDRLELKRLYHHIFRGGGNIGAAIKSARPRFTSPHAVEVLDFILNSRRGVCTESRR